MNLQHLDVLPEHSASVQQDVFGMHRPLQRYVLFTHWHAPSMQAPPFVQSVFSQHTASGIHSPRHAFRPAGQAHSPSLHTLSLGQGTPQDPPQPPSPHTRPPQRGTHDAHLPSVSPWARCAFSPSCWPKWSVPR